MYTLCAIAQARRDFGQGLFLWTQTDEDNMESSHDVTTVMLEEWKKNTAVMLEEWNILLWIELYEKGLGIFSFAVLVIF